MAESGPKLSARAVAKRCGVSHVAVLRAVREQRLPPLDQITDLDHAERLWRDQADPGKAMVAERARDEAPVQSAVLTREKIRRERALATIAELEVARLRGEMVDASAIRATLASMNTAVRDFLMAIPHSVADRVADVAVREGAAGVARELTTAITGALRGLASAEIVPAPKR